VEEYRGLTGDSRDIDQRIEAAFARHAATETPWKILTIVAVLAGLLGAILGIIAVVWFRGGFTLSGEVVGPLSATTLALLHPPGINCSAGQVPFHLRTLSNGLVVNATCAQPNETSNTLAGGCYGPEDDNFLNVEGSTNQVLIVVNASRVYKFHTPQDIANTSHVRFSQVDVAIGVNFPLPSPDFSATNLQSQFIAGLDLLSFSGFWNNATQLALAVQIQATAVGSNSTLLVCLHIPATAVNFTDTDIISWTSHPTSLAPTAPFAIPILLTVSTGLQSGVWQFGTPTTGGTLHALSGNFTNGLGSIGPYSFCYHA